jgi:hypothetical protein
MTQADNPMDRAKAAWERIFRTLGHDQPLGRGERSRTDATPEELRNLLILVATAFDNSIETGAIPEWQAKQVPLVLAVGLRWFGSATDGLIPDADQEAVLAALRENM